MRWSVFAGACGLALMSFVASAASETTYMKVLLEGRKVGQMSATRTVSGDRVTSTEKMDLVVERAGIAIPMRTEESSFETTAGKPLGFESSVTMSGIAMKTRGTITGDRLEIVQDNGMGEQKRTIPWPEGAVLAEGSRLAQHRHGLAPGTQYRLLVFQAMDQTPIAVDVAVLGRETLTLDGRRLELTRMTQAVELAGAKLVMQSWVDDQQDVRRSLTPLLGLDLEMIACDAACAAAPNQPASILDRSMIAAPRALSAQERRDGLVYDLTVSSTYPAQLPATSEQQARGRAGRVVVDVDPSRAKPDRTAPIASERAPTRFLNSDDPKVGAFATQATADATSDADRMLALEQAVRAYIDNKSMNVGYATASQTMASREGDCTEHAVLLAAAGRAIGIPTRVVSGLAYADRFAGREHVFVPHAWTQAFVDGEWRSYDAALAGFDAGHIALSYGDGEPSSFYGSVTLFGYLKIDTVEHAP